MQKPNIYYFNPTCELAVANGSFSYMPPLLLQEMESDLSALPFIYATSGDIVLSETPPSETFKRMLKEAGFELPEFNSLSELKSSKNSGFDALCPWGWSPASHFKLNDFKANCSEEFISSPVAVWKEQYKTLYERATSLKLLNDLLENQAPEWMIEKSGIGVIVKKLSEIEELVEKHQSLVIKAPLSSSGRGIQMIRKTELNNSNRQWISGVLKQQNYLIAEPLLNKQIDLSFQFKITGSGLKYLGHSIFETNPNGQYKGTLLNASLKTTVPEADRSKFEEMVLVTADRLKQSLHQSDYLKFHRGFLGVDALIYLEHDQLKMQPCIEINCRMNMGIVAMHLEKRIAPESTGTFSLFSGKAGDFKRYATEQQKTNPIRLKDGKIISGFLPLTEPDLSKKFGAYLVSVLPR